MSKILLTVTTTDDLTEAQRKAVVTRALLCLNDYIICDVQETRKQYTPIERSALDRLFHKVNDYRLKVDSFEHRLKAD